jgi:phosphoribosylamine-glycine ligase
MKPYLQKIKFKGDFDLNCVVNKNGAFILEATPRFGSPIIHLQQQLNLSPWGEFLNAIARGQAYDLKWTKGYGIVVLIAAQPFPTSERDNTHSLYGLEFSMSDLTASEREHVFFEEVAAINPKSESYYIADRCGYIAYVANVTEKITDSQKKIYEIIEKLAIPKTFYRNDIGSRFLRESKQQLIDLGYFKNL